jgi:hypothetical protein
LSVVTELERRFFSTTGISTAVTAVIVSAAGATPAVEDAMMT